MNSKKLADNIRDHADELDELSEGESEQSIAAVMRDDAELLRVLSRILEGKTVERAFGAPGDWGYSTEIGAALAERG